MSLVPILIDLPDRRTHGQTDGRTDRHSCLKKCEVAPKKATLCYQIFQRWYVSALYSSIVKSIVTMYDKNKIAPTTNKAVHTPSVACYLSRNSNKTNCLQFWNRLIIPILLVFALAGPTDGPTRKPERETPCLKYPIKVWLNQTNKGFLTYKPVKAFAVETTWKAP